MEYKNDPVNMEIMWKRVISIAEECWIAIWRTSFSVVGGEALDYGYYDINLKREILRSF